MIRLVHYTIQEYLERTPPKWLENLKVDIAVTCLTLLCFDIFERGLPCLRRNHYHYYPKDFDYSIRERTLRTIERHPLCRYAASNWNYHLSVVSPNELLDALVLKFLHNTCNVQASLVIGQNEDINFFGCAADLELTGLHLAAYFGNESATRALLHTGHTPDPPGRHQRTPLSWAADCGHEEITQILLGHACVDADSRDLFGKSPLAYAAESGSTSIIKLLLDRNADIDSKDAFGLVPIMYAARSGNAGVVQLLLERGAKADLLDDQHRTPLLIAASAGHLSIVDLLLSRDVDVNSMDLYRGTPLLLATWYGHVSVVERLLCEPKLLPDTPYDDYDNADKNTPLLSSCRSAGRHPRSESCRIVDLLLADGRSNPNCRDCDKNTPLMVAAKHGWSDITLLLLRDERVDLNAHDNLGTTALSHASREGHSLVVAQLLGRNDIKVGTESDFGSTPLSLASYYGRTLVVGLLLDNGVDREHGDQWGCTPLAKAAMEGHETVVKMLLKDGNIDPNPKDKFGNTPLFWAAIQGHESVIDALLSAGADIDAANAKSVTTLRAAIEQENYSIVKKLLEVEAAIYRENHWGLADFVSAMRRGYNDIEAHLRGRLKCIGWRVD